jgi:hypothetical protein
MTLDVNLRVDGLRAKKAYDIFGNSLGVVEAVGFRRGIVRRIGVPTRDSERRGLKFFSVEDASLDGDQLIVRH